jgi:hypothetical protein
MYAGVGALTMLWSVPESCERNAHRDGIKAYLFRTGGGTVVIGWRSGGETRPLEAESGVAVRDLMGNPLEKGAAC